MPPPSPRRPAGCTLHESSLRPASPPARCRLPFSEALDLWSETGSLASEARGLISESVDTATGAAGEVLQAPLRWALLGVMCMLLPLVLVLLVPLLILFSPVLLPLGLGMTIFGLFRAGLVMLLGHPSSRLARSLHGNRRQALSEARKVDEPHALHFGADGAIDAPVIQQVIRPKEGTLRELNKLAATRAGQAMKQVTALVRSSVARAKRDISGEVEAHLHALQFELQSWAAANPNLKPYCHGQIGWLLRQEARESGMRSASAMSLARTEIEPDSGYEDQIDEKLVCELPDLSHTKPVNELSLQQESIKLHAIGTQSRPRRRSVTNSTHGGKVKWGVKQRPELDASGAFQYLISTLPPSGEMLTAASLNALPLPQGVTWSRLGFILVPGLLTKWYPLYMKHLVADMKRLGLRCHFSRIDTDQPVRVNAARLRHEVLEMAQEGRRVMLLGHSKGAVDATAAISLFPELCDFIAGVVSLQGPHGGSAIAHDLSNTELQKTVVLGALEKLLRACKHAIRDLSFESRQEFLHHHPYPLERVPTLCVATCERRRTSLLKPLIDYAAVRYGAACDGLVCQDDAILPRCRRVIIDNMDHFGPAWSSFPATDSYDPTRLWLTCVSLALVDKGRKAY